MRPKSSAGDGDDGREQHGLERPAAAPELADLLAAVRARTPARLLVGRSGGSYRTDTQLELRHDHAAAVDAVRTELDLARDFGQEFIARYGLFEVSTRASTKTDYLMRPDLGRRLSDAAREEVAKRCPGGADLQIVIGDGLSSTAVVSQVPQLLPLLSEGATTSRGWRVGQTFVIRHCRVGVLNDVGDLLDPAVVVLLIGERPGLATAESLSAYMAFRPRAGHTDAQRNLISNIHARGVAPEEAAQRILRLAEQMMRRQLSGAAVKEEMAGGCELSNGK
ncbi:MAG: ethanolamine ammonia-lyase subunit EutC [Terriglobales bacterium]